MDMNLYQEQTRLTAFYPDAREESEEAITYCILGLTGEVGEIPNKWKKWFRDNQDVFHLIHGTAQDQVEYGATRAKYTNLIAAELGDVLWYVARLADELGFSLEEIAEANLDKLFSRQERNTLTGSGDNR